MTLVDEAAEVLGVAAVPASLEPSGGPAAFDVPADDWVRSLLLVRDDLRCRFFDWLSAVDLEGEGFSIVAHLARFDNGVEHLLLRTRIPRENPRLETATGVYAGAVWHERETHEMFGIDFAGHPGLDPLLLPDEFEGHPLRKDFVLASRVAKPWPGAKEPGESDATTSRAPSRRRLAPPGVPSPDEWGPRPPGES